MRPRNDRIIRPLIQMSRADILRYLKERGVRYREDASNADTAFLRNRIRHDLLPLLEKDFQPKAKKLLAQSAALLAEDYAFLVQSALLLSSRKATETSVECSRSELLALPLSLLRHRLRLLIRPFLGGKPPGKGLLDEIIKSLRSAKSKPQTLASGGLKFVRKGDRVRLLFFTR
jgi:tRNA(Ile)-lysidine synthase TilS/MesJ